MEGKYVKQRIQKVDGTYLQRQYRLIKQLGKGTFANCWQAIRISDKKRYAMKIIKKQLLANKRTRSKMLSEIKIHGRVKHKNICQLQRAFEDEQYVYVLLQICINGNLFQLLRKRKKFTVPEAQYFLYQLIDALCYLHSRDIIHRDLKLGNILIDQNINLKIADFGLATKLQFKGDLKHSVCGTPNYMAPQIIMGQMQNSPSGHSFEVDIWSVGVILYLFLIGKPPFQTDNKQKTFKRIIKADYVFPQSFTNNEAKDLIKNILVVDPCKRYTFQQIMSHAFMNPYNGIPKSLPLSSLDYSPIYSINIESYDKQIHKTIKKAARDASASTLRSEVSLNQQELDEILNNQSDKKKQVKTKNVRGLLSTALSASSSLSKSLKKLWTMRQNSNSKQKNLKIKQGNKNMVIMGNKSMLSKTETTSQLIGNFRSYTEIELNKVENADIVYIVHYKQQQVWTYQLSNGYTGTYETGYQLLYNNHNNIFIQIQGQKTRVLKKVEEAGNEKLSNRKKYLKKPQYVSIQCKAYTNSQKLISIKKIYKPKDQNTNSIILFRLSNGTFQAHYHKKDLHLLITQNDIMMIELQDGKQLRRVTQNKKNYQKCPSNMIQLYLQVKKMIKIITQKQG